MTVLQAYQYALDPTPAQATALRSHCGGQRFAYNWGLAQVNANLDQRAAEKSYDIPDDKLTPPLSWSAYSLRKDWNQAKDEVAPWWADNSKEAYASGLANLASALKSWDDSRAGKRRGPKIRFPRFKGRRKTLSCRFTTGAFGLSGSDRRHVKLPRIGLVRTHESTRSWSDASSGIPPVSGRRPCRISGAGGSCRSPWKSLAPIPRRRSRGWRWALTWVSRPWRCCRPAR
jgi:putative transposase